MLGWFIVLIPTAIIIMYTILAIILGYNIDDYYAGKKINVVLTFLYTCKATFYGTTVFSMICIVVIGIVMLCSHVESRSFIVKYKGVTTEYKIRQNTFSVPERIALFNYAVDLTAEATVHQYWDKYFDPFIPDEIHNLKPIR